MNINIKFNTDNAAFEDGNLHDEIVGTLMRIARKFKAGNYDGGAIMDTNGNKIGEVEVSD